MVDDATKLTMINFVDNLEKLSLLGHSFGGLLEMYYSIEHPDKIESLILVGSDLESNNN